MSVPIPASQRARDCAKNGDLKGALKIVSGWRPSEVVSKDQLKVMSLGYECLVRPDFYRSLGRDVDLCVSEAKKVFLATLFKE